MKNSSNDYFFTIVEEGSLSKAAQKLYLSQPSLSQYLKRLEKRLGVDLFDHNTSPLKLTYSGERYYEFLCEEKLREEQIIQELKDIKQGTSGRIRLGIAFWRAACFLPEVFPEFHRQFPNILVNIASGISTAEDCYHVIRLGADGTGATSGILTAKNPVQQVREMVKAVKKASRENEEDRKNSFRSFTTNSPHF